MTIRFLSLLCFLVTLSVLTFGQEVVAQSKTEAPALLQADQLTNDEKNKVVTATGNVELSQDNRVLLADQVSYNQTTGIVTAVGNVRILEPTGEVIFANKMEITDDLKDGFVDQIRVRLTDNSRFAAASGRRMDGERIELNRAVYTPCESCKKNPERSPLWQIKADKITHDTQTKDIVYRDAWFEMWGIPVLYTPYFSHPDPTVERRSGFLPLDFGRSADIGAFARGSYYFDIGPSMDATLEAGFSQKDGPLLGGEWRQRFENGRLQFKGAVVHADREEDEGDETIKHRDKFRGFIFGDGLFDLNEHWRTGFDVNLTTDNSFLRRYEYSSQDILTSKAFAEGFYDRSYANITAYGFQDLRPDFEDFEHPMALPDARLSLLGDPGSLLGGRWSFDAGALFLTRESETDTSRLSVQGGWQREWITDFGLVTTLSARLRADLYHVSDSEDNLDPFTSAEPDDNDFRVFPQAQILARYPFVSHGETLSHTIEPIVAYTVASDPDNADIPNEDSRDVEFDTTNLFSMNRFTGVDRLEGGHSLTYGARYGVYGDMGSASLFFGQNYRFDKENDMPDNSGLEERLSDFVGRLDVAMLPYMDLSYSFRLDDSDLSSRRHSLSASTNVEPVQLGVNYLYLDDSEGVAGDAAREEITTAGRLRLTDYWSVTAGHRRDLSGNSDPIYTNAGLLYQDECFGFGLYFQRDYTRREDLESGDSIFFRLSFKNLADLQSPTFSGMRTGQSQRETNVLGQ